jgi:hypothetical protein
MLPHVKHHDIPVGIQVTTIYPAAGPSGARIEDIVVFRVRYEH